MLPSLWTVNPSFNISIKFQNIPVIGIFAIYKIRDHIVREICFELLQ